MLAVSIKSIFILFICESFPIANAFIRFFSFYWMKQLPVSYVGIIPQECLILWSFRCLNASSVLSWFASADPSRDLVSQVNLYKMELSVSVQKGLRLLADPSVFARSGFQVLVDASFRSLLSSHGDSSLLGEPSSPARRRLCLHRYFRCSPREA